MPAQMLADGLYAGDDTTLIFSTSEGSFHLSAHGIPLSGLNLRMNATVSNNLNAAVCQQQVNQDAIVMFRIPNAQLREDFHCTLTRQDPLE